MSRRLSDKLSASFRPVVHPAFDGLRCCVGTTLGNRLDYFHSAGPYRKSGPKTGGFLELLHRMDLGVPIPGKPISF